jgi:hypothetical protein
MNQRNDLKNQNNNTDDEMDSFNDEEDEENNLFMNKKELVHIENDTSINVDKSFEDDHSKTSTMKKGGLIINNISAINEQFSQAIDLSDKKIADTNFFTKQLNGELADFNDTGKLEVNPLTNFKEVKNNIKINPTNYFETFNKIATSEEHNNNMNNMNILNNMIIGNKNYIDNEKNKQSNKNNYSIYNFNHKYIGLGSVNQNGETNLSIREYQNKYNQLETKYYNLNNQYKKLKNDYDEINNSNKSLLELLSYWQKFYLEVKEIVLPEERKNNHDISVNDYMDDPYRIQVIDEVKKLIIISRDRAYKNYYKTTINNFAIINKINNNNTNNKWNKNIFEKKAENFCIQTLKLNNDYLNDNLNNLNNLKISKKFLDESDDLDFLPPIKYIEKVNVGINTDNTENETNKEFCFESKKLMISKKINNYSFFEIKGNNNNKLTMKEDNIRIKKVIANPSNINSKNKQKELQINSLENFVIKGKPSLPKKFKKNTTYKFKFIQTDITNDNMTTLLSFKNEKETIQKQYEEKITTLNNYIKNNISTSRNNSNKKVNNYSNIKNEDKSPNKNINNNNNSNPKIFLPEMIPPENTYKIFMNCIKNIKYEEGIYKKFMQEDDLYNLKNFVEKMEKYLYGTSLPVLKAKKRKDYIIHTKINNESNTQKKFKERILNGNKGIFSNINSKKRNISDSKNYYDRSSSVLNNNIIFNKYKAAIMSLKDTQ